MQANIVRPTERQFVLLLANLLTLEVETTSQADMEASFNLLSKIATNDNVTEGINTMHVPKNMLFTI